MDRRRDLSRLGPSFGVSVPERRSRAVVPFLDRPGAILEIKRASPSKGDIAPNLDPAVLTAAYADAGASAVSVLTERNYFRGSLADLIAASASRPGLAYLRKDFLLEEDELEISYRAGADAVLLIARILDEGNLKRMAAACRSFGMMPFVEVREESDVAKLRAVAADGPVLSGVNARDLATFSIDPLAPAALRCALPGAAVYESGIDSPEAAAYARRLGFDGILVGEAAARNPGMAASVVAGFLGARPDGAGAFWRAVAERRAGTRRPLVKICGLTRPDDALLAARLGADLLGFVFAESKRTADGATVRELARSLSAGKNTPLRVGVMTELDSAPARQALSLARDGFLDAIQWHGEGSAASLAALEAALTAQDAETMPIRIGRYAAIRLGHEDDLAVYDGLRKAGEPRVLADARVEGLAGGTGVAVPASLAGSLAARGGLWLAGGLGPGGSASLPVGQAITSYAPELIDASSKLETSPGRKDPILMERYFKEIEQHAR